jgi:hypothetical protein
MLRVCVMRKAHPRGDDDPANRLLERTGCTCSSCNLQSRLSSNGLFHPATLRPISFGVVIWNWCISWHLEMSANVLRLHYPTTPPINLC